MHLNLDREESAKGSSSRFKLPLSPIILVTVLLFGYVVISEYITNFNSIDQVQWWKKTNFYHIYVRSFKDSDGNGEGDILGIIEKLDYLKQIGAETILMSPVYKSPMADGGYDISDYFDINPLFGNMSNFEYLLSYLKAFNMRIIMDFVPNHSSKEHYWFNCSERALIDVEECGRYKDYYIWSSSRRFNGTYPTNWISVFGGGSAWEWSPIRKQFYLHQFLPEQPDLNLTNPLVRQEMKEIARFWLSKGVDGLRVDSAPFLLEDYEHWRDEPINENWKRGDDPYLRLKHNYTFSYGKTPEIVKDWRDVCNEFDGDRVIINEAYATDDELVRYYGRSPYDRFVDLNFGFGLLYPTHSNMNPRTIEYFTMRWFNKTRALNWPNDRGTINPWLTWVLGNHDNPRRANVVGENNVDILTWIAFLLPGTPVSYYGDELGMANANEADIPSRTLDSGEASRLVERALMAWDPRGPSGGFSTNDDCWMPLPRNYKSHNVETMLAEERRNHLKNYIDIQKLRKRFIDTLTFGDVHIIYNYPVNETSIFAMLRNYQSPKNLLLLVNLHESLSQIVRLIQNELEPKLPDEGTVEIMNRESDSRCNFISVGDLIEINHLILCPSQAIVVSY